MVVIRSPPLAYLVAVGIRENGLEDTKRNTNPAFCHVFSIPCLSLPAESPHPLFKYQLKPITLGRIIHYPRGHTSLHLWPSYFSLSPISQASLTTWPWHSFHWVVEFVSLPLKVDRFLLLPWRIAYRGSDTKWLPRLHCVPLGWSLSGPNFTNEEVQLSPQKDRPHAGATVSQPTDKPRTVWWE